MIQAFRDFVWGLPLIILILGTGSFLTITGKGFQVAHFFHIIKSTFSKDENAPEGKNVLTPVEAVSVAVGSAVGVGNIGGVSTAIAIGGPGALFWIWVASFMGMMIKMAEVSLAVYYRKTDENGETYGGPSYYIERGIGEDKGFKFWRPFAILFAFGIGITAFITLGNYNTSEAVASTFNIHILIPSVLYAGTVLYIVAGGIKGLGKIASKLVPAMCIFYVAVGLIIIVLNAGELPGVLKMIVSDAFTGSAAVGGFAGAAIAQAIRTGFARAVYSNEAGWGTSPMVHATANTSHPIRQGMMGAFEVFADTMVVCSITALVILVTGEWSSGVTGAALTLNAYETVLGKSGRILLTFCIFFLGVTTASGWYSYFEVLLRHFLPEKSKFRAFVLKYFRYYHPLPGFLMVLYIVVAGRPGSEVWLFADIATGIPTFVNVVAVLMMSSKFFELLKDYKSRYLGIGKVDPNFSVFYEDELKKKNKEKV